MRWRKGVTVERANGAWLRDEKQRKRVAKDDLLIVELIESGIVEDDDLLKKVSLGTKEGEIPAGFRLAQFVEDYGYFLEEGQRARIFDS